MSPWPQLPLFNTRVCFNDDVQDLKSFLNSNLKNAPVLFNKILLPVHTINYMFFFFFTFQVMVTTILVMMMMTSHCLTRKEVTVVGML